MAVPLYYTFGNHMHWADMQWLWGYGVLPGSVRDMIHLIDRTGVRGNVNFDAVGYERMAAECPEALADLRRAIADGRVEPVGCSYGQPYGLFQGGESNVRQFTFGVRSVMRLLGTRPKCFWEEEFYCFPQLPQMLVQCGYTGACLFFQWTWHTPEIPTEPYSLVLWEGIDGSRVPSLPRNNLNVHQWPEDFDGLLENVLPPSPLGGEGEGEGSSSSSAPALPSSRSPSAIVQWLELMPSRDWMCRSEILLPRLTALLSDPRFEVHPRTMSVLIEELRTASGDVPVRRYGMDDVWHGMTLGKNADLHPRTSRRVEGAILAAEALAATVSLFGRPYASWDAYPVWELDEAWRELLAAQHHDNHECEGLCGFVGHHQMARAAAAAAEVAGRCEWLVRARTRAESLLVTNPLGCSRSISTGLGTPVEVPPFGYTTRRMADPAPAMPAQVRGEGEMVVVSRGPLEAYVSRDSGAIVRIRLDGEEMLGPGANLGTLRLRDEEGANVPILTDVRSGASDGGVHVEHGFGQSSVLRTRIDISPDARAIDMRIDLGGFGVPGPGLRRSLQMALRPGLPHEILAAGPYSVERVRGSRVARRKYPTGDWMTSPQWFEELDRPFASGGFVDFSGVSGGVLACFEATQQWFAEEGGAWVVLTAADPWDEGRYSHGELPEKRIRIMLHRGMTNAERVAAAERFAAEQTRPAVDRSARPVGGGTAAGVEADMPVRFGPLEVLGAPGVMAHAFYRESMRSGEHLPLWAGHRMFEASGGACDHPFVVRLVEWNGEAAEVALTLAGPVAMAAKTNLMGEVGDWRVAPGDAPAHLRDTGWLEVEHPAPLPEWAEGRAIEFEGKAIGWSRVRFRMRPREIATIYADMVMGRKQWRDLDAKREMWATVHRV